MRIIRARVSINAMPVDVFRVLTDFGAYVNWNPWLKDVRGVLTEGERVSVRPNMISLFGFRITYRLERIQAPDTLQWREVSWFDSLFYTIREYRVYTKASGGSIYSVGLTFGGPLSSIVGAFYGRSVRHGLRNEAEALKKYCEAHYILAEHQSTQKPLMKSPSREYPLQLRSLPSPSRPKGAASRNTATRPDEVEF